MRHAGAACRRTGHPPRPARCSSASHRVSACPCEGRRRRRAHARCVEPRHRHRWPDRCRARPSPPSTSCRSGFARVSDAGVKDTHTRTEIRVEERSTSGRLRLSPHRSVRSVCAACNNGWMSDLEDAAASRSSGPRVLWSPGRGTDFTRGWRDGACGAASSVGARCHSVTRPSSHTRGPRPAAWRGPRSRQDPRPRAPDTGPSSRRCGGPPEAYPAAMNTWNAARSPTISLARSPRRARRGARRCGSGPCR